MRHLTDIITNPARRANLETRYWPKVQVGGPSECWPWVAKATHPFGYGRMTAGRHINLKAHQISWALQNGPIPDGMLVCHRCDRPACCNPAHMFLGSQSANMGDAKAKGRTSPPPRHLGERHPRAKLTKHQVKEISMDGRAAEAVAVQYGISTKTVYRIRWGQRPVR